MRGEVVTVSLVATVPLLFFWNEFCRDRLPAEDFRSPNPATCCRDAVGFRLRPSLLQVLANGRHLRLSLIHI